MHILNQSTLDRRTFLHASAVSLALPLLDAMIPIAYGQTSRAKSAALQPRRMVLIHRPLGTYHPHLVPTATGLNYEATRFLQKLEPHRGRFTLFSGMGHPDYPNSHNTEPAIFTGVPEFHEHDLHNTVSLDQVAAQKVGSETRFPYLLLNKVWSQSLSWNEKGVPIPHEAEPVSLFRRMFIEGTPEEMRIEMKRLQQGKSILDDLRNDLKTLSKRPTPSAKPRSNCSRRNRGRRNRSPSRRSRERKLRSRLTTGSAPRTSGSPSCTPRCKPTQPA
jgi:hypothetical protein